MNQDLSIVSLILNASWVVQAVVALLVGVSIASWAAIFRKIVALKKVQKLNDDFDREFWSGTSLNDLFAGAAQKEQVIVFAVNATGLAGTAPDARGAAEAPEPIVAARRQSLRALTEETGGFALLDDVDVAEAMSRIRAAVLAIK